MKFIYVFNKEAKETLAKSGYRLLQEIENNNSSCTAETTYVFENKSDCIFDLLDKSKYMATNTLMF